MEYNFYTFLLLSCKFAVSGTKEAIFWIINVSSYYVKCYGFIEKGFVDTRDSENPKAKLEYKISEKGKIAFTKCISFDPGIKFVLGLKDTEFFPTEN